VRQAWNVNVEPLPLSYEDIGVPRFSFVITILSGAIVLAYFVWLGWNQLLQPRLNQIDLPEQALPLLIGRMMELKDSLKEIPYWERSLYRVMLVDSPDDLFKAIGWYEELAANSSDPRIHVQLAILEGEAGRVDRVSERVAAWEAGGKPYRVFADWIKVAYLHTPPGSGSVPPFDTERIRLLGGEWFHDRLILRLAERTGDHTWLSAVNETLDSRLARIRGLVRRFIAIDLGIMLGGGIAFVILLRRLRREPKNLTIGTAPIPPPWSGAAGAAVLLRCGAIVALMRWSLSLPQGLGEVSIAVLWLCVSLVGTLAALALTRQYLTKPVGWELRQAFGLWTPTTAWQRLLLWIPCLLALGWTGDWVISWTGEWFGLASHWTELFQSDLVWGSSLVLVFNLIDATVFAPIFEELLFRGLVFATLRRQFRSVVAAALSAAIFSSLHGYSLLGFASIFWTGVLWAWAYEKTGSLLPGIVAHGLSNLGSSFALITFLRW
jgi:membrane protease YdiL (CAAX protease family)